MMKLHEHLTHHAKQHPEKTAVVHSGNRLSYAELDALSNSLAAALIERGVVKGDRVALFLENSPGFVISYFGILKAGAAVVAMNAMVVQRELQFLVSDCEPKVLITDTAHARTVNGILAQLTSPLNVLTMDEEMPKLASAADPALHLPVQCDDTGLAAIIYTSGTTGKPKGVMLSHGNITANVDSIIEYLHLTSDDTIMVVLPFYYSYGASLLTTHIRIGGTLVIDNRFIYPNTILDTMVREGVTGFAGVPSHYAILLRKSNFKNYTFPKLRYVTQAGGPMSPAMIQEFIDILPQTKFYVMYGQTEATARLSYMEPEFLKAKMGSIGKGIPGVDLEVITDQGTKAAPGEMGEIVARGKNIMIGYWNAPDETNKVLRNGALYTGDLAKTDEDGFFYIVSRKKDMIKSGANRISPREIEDIVCQMPGILESAAIGVPDEILGEAIKLCVVKTDGAGFTEKDVQIFCRQNLALFKNPKFVEIVASLPKTASGKVKREELKALHNNSRKPQ